MPGEIWYKFPSNAARSSGEKKKMHPESPLCKFKLRLEPRPLQPPHTTCTDFHIPCASRSQQWNHTSGGGEDFLWDFHGGLFKDSSPRGCVLAVDVGQHPSPPSTPSQTPGSQSLRRGYFWPQRLDRTGSSRSPYHLARSAQTWLRVWSRSGLKPRGRAHFNNTDDFKFNKNYCRVMRSEMNREKNNKVRFTWRYNTMMKKNTRFYISAAAALFPSRLDQIKFSSERVKEQDSRRLPRSAYCRGARLRVLIRQWAKYQTKWTAANTGGKGV